MPRLALSCLPLAVIAAACSTTPAPPALVVTPCIVTLPAGGPPAGDVVMPWVAGGAPGAAARINDALWRGELGLAPLRAPGDRFVAPPGTRASELTFLRPSVDRQDDAVFEVTLRGESCGANCEPFTQVFAFESATGRRIVVEDLLTGEGLRAAAALMRDRRRTLYAAQVEALLREQARPGLAGDIVEDLQQRLALARRCLDMETPEPPASDDPRAARFSLPAGGSLTLVSAGCASHAERALDDVGSVTLELAPDRLAPWLTPFGRDLLTPGVPGSGRPTPPA